MKTTKIGIFLTNSKDAEVLREFLQSCFQITFINPQSISSDWNILIVDTENIKKYFHEIRMFVNKRKPVHYPILIFAKEIELKEISKEIWSFVDDILRIPIHQEFLLNKLESLSKLHNYSLDLEIANKTKEKFLSIIAHDLRNSFHTILGLSSELLKNFHALESSNQQILVESIYQTARATYNLFENLLNWAKSQKNSLEFHPKHIFLYPFIEETISLLNILAKRKQIQIKNEVNNSTVVYADVNMLSLILQNLITNAIKFTNTQGEIKIQAKKLSSEFIEISIIDSGIGISEERIPQLFTLHGSNSTLGTNFEKGTGFGLVLCKEFIEKHNGTIKVTSKEKEGTCFSFTLPNGNPHLVEEKLKEKSNLEPLKPLKILAADDEPISQSLLETILKTHGHDIKVCENGKELIEQVLEFLPDLILVDLEMPVLNGFQTVLKLKEMHHPHLHKIPILAMTGHDLSETENTLKEYGFSDYITKPFTYTSFLQKVNLFPIPK